MKSVNFAHAFYFNYAKKALILCVLKCALLHAAPIALSFENPYPMTPCKKVVDACLLAWSDIDVCRVAMTACDDAYASLILGRVTWLCQAIKQFLPTAHEVHHDDLGYIYRMLIGMSKKLEDISAKQCGNEQLMHAHVMVKEMTELYVHFVGHKGEK